MQWLGLDCEHTSSDISTVESIARSIQGTDTTLLVRVSQCDPLEIRRCLDVGASDVIIPLVESAEQIKIAISAAKYPPRGTRGYGFGRMNKWGLGFEKYAATADEQSTVIAMIESRHAVDNIDLIISVPGLNGIFIGLYDLSASYGIAGQLQHELLRKAYQTVMQACQRKGIPAGQHIVHSSREKIQEAIASGFRLICLGADTIFMTHAAANVLQLVDRCK